MKKEAKILLSKGTNSLVLSIEHFNRPYEVGRTEAVLIFLNHAFEMLLKAGILHRGGRIRRPREKQTMGFDECVRKALSDGDIKFLSDEQALTLETINTLRDSAEHHYVSLSEELMYVHSQAGLTLFRDILKAVFSRDLADALPGRVMPISTKPPTDMATLFQNEVASIRTLLRPGKRKKAEAYGKLRGLSIVEGAIQGDHTQPTEGELRRLGMRIAGGETWNRVFPGVASIELTAKGYGPSLDLRIAKKQGVPIHIVPEGTPGAAVVAIRRVDELAFYNLSLTDLAKKVNLTGPRALALILHLRLQDDRDCFKEVKIGAVRFKRYSEKALGRLNQELPVVDMEKVWAQYAARLTRRRTG